MGKGNFISEKTSFPKTNCSTDADIRCLKNCFFDIDVVSNERSKGYPASEQELKKSLLAAEKLSRISSLEAISTICCSGNGHYVVSAIEPIKITDNTISEKFKIVCSDLAKTITKKIDGIKIDPVYNLSRVMRLMGTINRKGKATRLRPHRKADIIRQSANLQSVYLSQKIINLNINQSKGKKRDIGTRNCNIAKIESCEFIKWCRSFPTEVSEPLWFAMITNLAPLKGGDKLIHDISRLDTLRYTYRQTQNLIERVIEKQYQPTRCDSICQLGFQCPKYGLCNIKAPMYLTVNQMDSKIKQCDWPTRPDIFPDLMTPTEAAMFLRLDQFGHTPSMAIRTLNYWRDRGDLKATKYARRVWYLKAELQKFLKNKTEK